MIDTAEGKDHLFFGNTRSPMLKHWKAVFNGPIEYNVAVFNGLRKFVFPSLNGFK